MDHQLPERFSHLKALTGDPGVPRSRPVGGCVLFAPNGGPQMPTDTCRDVQARPARLIRYGTAEAAGRRARRQSPRALAQGTAASVW